MNTTVAGADVRRYIEAVRTHLGYLPAEDRDELLEDLEEHLLEVAAEADGSLEQRLGPAAAYAEELRASAGLAGGARAIDRGIVERVRHSTVAQRATQLTRWATRSRRFRFALMLCVVLAAGIAIGRSSVSLYLYSDDPQGFQPEASLQHADGSSIANICPYSADGTLLTGVLLFDQFGRPITNSANDVDGRTIEQARPAILNVYPKAISYVDFQGEKFYPETGETRVEKTLTPLQCPATVTAGPPVSSTPASSAGP
jgi:HAAS domain-containing protein